MYYNFTIKLILDLENIFPENTNLLKAALGTYIVSFRTSIPAEVVSRIMEYNISISNK